LRFPVIAAGAAGIGFILTANVLAGLTPHALEAVTFIVPPVLPAVTLIEVPVEEPLIDQPAGNVHV
jgi:hypothetical protein